VIKPHSAYLFAYMFTGVCVCLAAELCKKLKQEQAEMRDEAEQLSCEIRTLEADVRYHTHSLQCAALCIYKLWGKKIASFLLIQ